MLELGAGTGKLTRQLARRDLEVTAVEPSPEMLEELHRQLPEAEAVIGSAEKLPLPDDTFDLVVAAQAWHWFDVRRAAAEAARVLRPGGRLGLVWNSRDDRVDWVAELSEILDLGAAPMDPADPEIGGPFGQAEYFALEWRVPMSQSGLIDLVASRSYVIVAPEPERRRILLRVRDLLDHHPALTGRERFELPYVTYCTRAHVA